MVYSQALVFGYGLSAGSEEDNLAGGMWRKVLQHFRAAKEPSGHLKKANSSSSLESECSLEDDDLEASIQQQQDLAVQLEKCLVMAKASVLQCSELLVPSRMSTRVARDVLRASEPEPCGLRGALIHVFAETQAGLQKVGTVTPEHSLTPTFELSVVFRVDLHRWLPLKHLLGSDGVLRLRPEYRLIKRKLYSSASPTVIEL
ncbi:DNA damage-inducible transcript 4-like protein-like [Neoarius graeffei]|uniref:DNA damage-inducible transcript 4-like protein-like n=1 Tax=Neoarius graeffei TaxID=443677 RepID=UPI00298BF187|nr:DNA damage-inducible transcript 4-like protein-like [Neoarius graeffei]